MGEEPGETSTANVIENYTFPEAIYNIIGYRVGTDLANSPKPPWLLDLEAGVTDAPTSMTEAGGPRGAGAYSYWNSPSDYTSWTYDRGGGGSSHRKDPYYYGQHGGASRQQGPYGNQLHTLPPLSLPRDMDAQSPVTTSPSTIGDPLSGGRYPYGSMGSRSQYGDVGRSPPTSTSPYDSQSGASPFYPPHPGSEPPGPVPPSAAGGQNGHITLPRLPDNPPSQHSDWKDRSVYPETSKYAPASYGSQSSRSGLPPLSNLPSLGSVASQTGSYGLPLSSTAQAWGSSYGSNWSDQRSLPTFQPTAFEARGRAYDGSQVPLTINGPLAMGEPMAWHSIYMWRERYPFLEQIAATPGLSVFHIDVYFSLPADWGMQMSEMSVDLSLRLRKRDFGMVAGYRLFLPAPIWPCAIPAHRDRATPQRLWRSRWLCTHVGDGPSVQLPPCRPGTRPRDSGIHRLAQQRHGAGGHARHVGVDPASPRRLTAPGSGLEPCVDVDHIHVLVSGPRSFEARSAAPVPAGRVPSAGASAARRHRLGPLGCRAPGGRGHAAIQVRLDGHRLNSKQSFFFVLPVCGEPQEPRKQ